MNGPIIKHIPKSARTACANLLINILKLIKYDPNDVTAWVLLLHFARIILAKPNRTGQTNSLSSIIKKRTTDYLLLTPELIKESAPQVRPVSHSHNVDDQLSKLITAKIEDGNIRAALRVLLSDDTLAEVNDATFAKLQDRHPHAAENRQNVPDPLPAEACLQVFECDVKAAISSFPTGSAGGPDGLRPQHVSDLLNCLEAGPALLTEITAVVNLLLQGNCTSSIIPIIFGGNLTALNKKSGGIRPIAVGYYWRRLSAKCANTYATTKLAPFFSPTQLGVGVKGGCEAAVHACRRFVDAMPDDYVVAKLDFKNAFNSLHRDAMLQKIHTHVPEIYSFCHLAYNIDSILKFGDRQIISEEGAQQGDPLGPLIFCLTIHHILESLNSVFIVGYMDDITLGGPRDVVANDVNTVAVEGSNIGLFLNTDKSELITKTATPVNLPPINQFVHFTVNDASLLGSPLVIGTAMDAILNKKLTELNRASSRLQLVSSHDALVLLKASCSAPKLMHQLRSSPCADHVILPIIDDTLRSCLVNITNVSINDEQWLQASLPIRAGGLGIRKVSAIASSAFLSSVSSTQLLQTDLLSRVTFEVKDHFYDRLLVNWSTTHHPVQPPVGNLASKQRSWDQPIVEKTQSSLLASQTTPYNRARLLATSAPHSGDWLHALPISSCGLRLDDEAIRVAVGLRLGSNLCEPHDCTCGSLVDCRGSHGLSCRRSSGRSARHSYLNDLIFHALCRAGISSTKEPTGLSRSDGKRPDGLTLIPWQGGKNAIWDVTVTDTLATSYIHSTSVIAGSAAELASSRKEEKYATLSLSHTFIPIAIETMGPIGSKALSFLQELGRRLTVATGNPRETVFLYQRLSVALQRFNAVCIHGTFDSAQDNDSE